MRDYRRMQANSNPGVMAMPRDDNIMIWHAVIFGCVFFAESGIVRDGLLVPPLPLWCGRGEGGWWGVSGEGARAGGAGGAHPVSVRACIFLPLESAVPFGGVFRLTTSSPSMTSFSLPPQPRRHAVGGRDVQPPGRVQRGVPEQAARCALPDENVSPQQ